MRLALLLFTLVALAACDSGGMESELGSFDAAFSGEHEERVEGIATYLWESSSTGPGLTLSMNVQEEGLGRRFTLADPEGLIATTSGSEFTLGNGASLSLHYTDSRSGTETGLRAIAGTVTIDRVESDRIVGSFEATMGPLYEYQSGGGTRVEGSFEAVYAGYTSY
ncbi:MAG TPA: hypothetical protein EYQ24_07880 [Bacteroidetes bacterium]|nr:hypothetical protein [Bacteroidota bacterium]HIL58733.1 hypothetical protein [Rhodothermales bacterium]